MERKIKVVYLDVRNGKEPVAMEIEDKLETFYDLIGCSAIDIVRRPIGGKDFNVIVDDEGLLKANVIISATSKHNFVELVGNLIIAGLATLDGELTSLTDEDVKKIINQCFIGRSMQRPFGYHLLRLDNGRA